MMENNFFLEKGGIENDGENIKSWKKGIENDGENIFFETVGVHMQLPTNVCVCK